MLYSVVIPCYKSDQTIRKVAELTLKQFEQMNRGSVEMVLVDDCSPDGGKTAEQLRSLVRDYPNIRAVELAHNCGQHNAVMAGLNYAKGDVIIAMDDDMQTHPSQIPKLLDELEKGYDIVYGYYPSKKHSAFRNFGSKVNHATVCLLLNKPRDMKTSSFWAIRRFVRDYAVEYRSAFTHLQGVFLRITRNISSVPVEHFAREVGTSNYTFKKLIQLWSNIAGFSIVPLHIATWLGYFFSAFGVLMTLYVIVHRLLHPQTAIGWPSMMAAICFFSGLNLMFMGLIGEYIGRIFLGLCNNPQYVVRQIDEQGKRPYLVNEDGQQFELKKGVDWRKERET